MDGWAITEPESPTTSPTGSAIRISNDPEAVPEIFLVVADGDTYDPSDLTTLVPAPATAKAWLAFLQHHPNLKVGTARSLSVDGQPALQANVAVVNVPSTMPKPCSDAAFPFACVPIWGTYPIEVGPVASRPFILTLLDVDGRPLAILGLDTPSHLETFRSTLSQFLGGLKFIG